VTGYDYEELINRDKASLDIFWLRDKSLQESDNLPGPDVLAQDIVVLRLPSLDGVEESKQPEAALEQFREIAADLGAHTPIEKEEKRQ
jgi:type I restriction enzyme M protein